MEKILLDIDFSGKLKSIKLPLSWCREGAADLFRDIYAYHHINCCINKIYIFVASLTKRTPLVVNFTSRLVITTSAIFISINLS